MEEQANENVNETVEETPEVATEQSHEPETDKDETPSQGWDMDKALEAMSKKNSENRNLRDRAKKAEAEIKDLSEYKSLYEQAQARMLRMEVAHEFQLPAELTARLQGNTREELMEDAEALMKLFQTRRVPESKPAPFDGKGTDKNKRDELTADELEKIMFSK